RRKTDLRDEAERAAEGLACGNGRVPDRERVDSHSEIAFQVINSPFLKSVKYTPAIWHLIFLKNNCLHSELNPVY
ncbi:MAG: hypothetical protein MI755_09475, partial [Sphingomonadales bacterium]|nr:hypothetical protein [Sphingomonadales bacterium]